MKPNRFSVVVLGVLFGASLLFNLYQLQSRAKGFPTLNSNLGSDILLAQTGALCEVAKEHLREHWSENKASIEKVIHVVNNKQEMEAKLKTDLVEVSQALNLKPEEITVLSTKYEKIFFPHVNKFRDNLNEKNPDWVGMFGTLKEFYVAEDQMINETFGQEGLTKFRESQLKKRTTMLALIGQYANIPWDTNISW